MGTRLLPARPPRPSKRLLSRSLSFSRPRTFSNRSRKRKDSLGCTTIFFKNTFLHTSDNHAMSAKQQIKSGTPDTNDLLNICSELRSRWQVLAKVLGFRELELEQIAEDHTDSFERCYQMFLRWIQMCGSQASYDVLARALQHPQVNRQDLAFQYCYKL